MKLIGIDGGHTTYELGPISDVILFFDCLDLFVKRKFPEKDWSVLTDRLYRRYLRKNDLEPANKLMEIAKNIFISITNSSAEWNFGILVEQKNTWLETGGNNLGEIFSRYFYSFEKARASAISFFEGFGVYQVVRLIPSDMPLSIIERARPLDEYDALDKDESPFWLR